MITYDMMTGRLGNIMLSISTVFYYCYIHNIDYSNICFTNTKYGPGFIHAFDYLDNILINIKKYFINKSDWLNLTKNNIKKNHRELKDLSSLDITFIEHNWKYFYTSSKDICSFIYNLFYNANIFKSVMNECEIKYPDYKNRIAFHIRRSDFLTLNSTKKYVLSKEDIINKIDNKLHYLIFSDDIEWCKNNIKNENCIFVDNLNDWKSLILMSYCKDVIENPYSTYSHIGYMFNIAIR